MSVTKHHLENSFHEMLEGLKQPTWYDYIDASGNIQQNVQGGNVMVRTQADLSSLTSYLPGTIAFTAGFVNMWQKKADGTWISML